LSKILTLSMFVSVSKGNSNEAVVLLSSDEVSVKILDSKFTVRSHRFEAISDSSVFSSPFVAVTTGKHHWKY
jgi:hypothetical protein